MGKDINVKDKRQNFHERQFRNFPRFVRVKICSLISLTYLILVAFLLFSYSYIQHCFYNTKNRYLNTKFSRYGHVIKHKIPLFGNFVTPFRDPLVTWEKRITKMCNDNFCGYSNLFCLLKGVQVDPSKIIVNKNSTGKDNITGNGFLKFRKGFFRQKCKNRPIYSFRPDDRLTDWLAALKVSNNYPIKTEKRMSNFAIAVTRYEYANLYHTMTDWFNIFLVTLFHKQNPGNCTVILMDDHPKTSMDNTWKTLFRQVISINKLKEPVFFDKLAWGITGYLSPLNQHKLNHVYYLEEFRNFFLFSHNILDNKILNCKNLSLLFILRRNYVAHPQNPNGHISRKISNERDLEKTLKKNFYSHTIQTAQLDKLSMERQLSLVANTDILIGMHGAGLTHSIFLPKHAGVIELFPKYWSVSNAHFKAISRWRGLHYIVWQNLLKENEILSDLTKIPARIMVRLVTKIKNRIC